MAKKTADAPVKVDPGVVLERYRALVPAETYACILTEINRSLPQALRVNQLQGVSAVEVNRWQETYGWDIKQVPFCAAGWQVLSAATPPIVAFVMAVQVVPS